MKSAVRSLVLAGLLVGVSVPGRSQMAVIDVTHMALTRSGWLTDVAIQRLMSQLDQRTLNSLKASIACFDSGLFSNSSFKDILSLPDDPNFMQVKGLAGVLNLISWGRMNMAEFESVLYTRNNIERICKEDPVLQDPSMASVKQGLLRTSEKFYGVTKDYATAYMEMGRERTRLYDEIKKLELEMDKLGGGADSNTNQFIALNTRLMQKYEQIKLNDRMFDAIWGKRLEEAKTTMVNEVKTLEREYNKARFGNADRVAPVFGQLLK